jgi:hypothetical protein
LKKRINISQDRKVLNNIELHRITRPLDVGFTSGANYNPWTWANRGSGAGFKNILNRDIPTHALLVTHDHGQVMATELRSTGIEEDSFVKYLRNPKRDRIMEIWRFTEWTESGIQAALKHLAYLRQQNRPYSWWEAIGKNRIVRKLFPRLTSRHNEARQTCDENVFTIHRDYAGWNQYPFEWDTDTRLMHPHTLRTAIRLDHRFKLVKEFPW